MSPAKFEHSRYKQSGLDPKSSLAEAFNPKANVVRNGRKQVSAAMTDNSSVILEKHGQAYWITINRPDKRNALNGEVIAGIAKGYRDAHDDRDVRVIVLTGAGDKAVCAG